MPLDGKRLLERRGECVALDEGQRLDELDGVYGSEVFVSSTRQYISTDDDCARVTRRLNSPPKALILSQSNSRLTLYSCSVSVRYCPYSRSIISFAPYLTSSSQHRTCIERMRSDLDVGVERWKRTESKSTNVWSSPDGLW